MKYVKINQIKCYIFLAIIFIFHFTFVFNGTFYSLAIKEEIVKTLVSFGSILLFLLLVVLAISSILSFRDFKFLNDLEKNIYSDPSITFVITILVVEGLFTIFYKTNKDNLFCMMIIFLYINLSIEAVYSYFVSRYVKLRKWYYVDEINIVTKDSNRMFKSVFSYIKNNNFLELIYMDDDHVKNVIVPVDEIKMIEKIIDRKKPYIRFYRESKK